MNVLIWILAWTPYAIVVLIATFGNSGLISPLISQVPSFFTKCAAAFNPLITMSFHPAFKKAIEEKFDDSEDEDETE